MEENTEGRIYVLSSAIKDVVKIGRSSIKNCDGRVAYLITNGYSNISGLKKELVVEVENYKAVERMLHDILERYKIANTEFFALRKELAIWLVSNIKGKEIYRNKSNDSNLSVEEAYVESLIPNGTYTHSNKKKEKSWIEIYDGKITLKKGSYISDVNESCNESNKKVIDMLNKDENNKLLDDFECNSVSMAASAVSGGNRNGWNFWKNKNGEPISIYRDVDSGEE